MDSNVQTENREFLLISPTAVHDETIKHIKIKQGIPILSSKGKKQWWQGSSGEKNKCSKTCPTAVAGQKRSRSLVREFHKPGGF